MRASHAGTSPSPATFGPASRDGPLRRRDTLQAVDHPPMDDGELVLDPDSNTYYIDMGAVVGRNLTGPRLSPTGAVRHVILMPVAPRDLPAQPSFNQLTMLNQAAIEHLSAADPVLGAVIAAGRAIHPRPHEDLYLALLRAIVSQQISTKAAAAIWKRFQALFPPEGYPEPRAVLALSEDELRAAGLSRQKASYLKAIAEHNERGLLDYDHLISLSEEAFTQHLTAIKGVGRWTAQMLQLFALDQPDVFAEDDLGVQNAMRKHYGLAETGRALQKRMVAITEAWRPYRSLACKYLWQSLDQGTQIPPSV